MPNDCAQVNKTQTDREKVRMTLDGQTDSRGQARLRTGTSRNSKMQTDTSSTEKSYFFHSPPHPESFPGAGKIPQTPLPTLLASLVACPLTPQAEEAGRPHRNLSVRGEWRRAGGRD